MRVEVAYSLKKNKFSIRKGNHIIGYGEKVILKDVNFRVRKGGREKVLETKQKNVHAHVIGEIVGIVGMEEKKDCRDIKGSVRLMELAERGIFENKKYTRKVTYNPFKEEFFHLEDTGIRVDSASEVLLSEKAVWLLD